MGTMSLLIFGIELPTTKLKNKNNKKNLTPSNFWDVSGKNCVKHFFVEWSKAK